jgi:hypothetical protein
MARHPEVKSKTKIVTFKPVTVEEEKVADDFKRLCIQDGLSVHDLMLEAFQLVFKVHHWPLGNPQLTLTNYQQKITLERCGFINCKNKVVGSGLFYPKGERQKGEKRNLCELHYNLVLHNSREWGHLARYQVSES